MLLLVRNKNKKNMKTISFIILLLISGSLIAENIGDKSDKSSSAANKQITGKVTDRLTGENLAGVKIEIPETNTVVYSDFDGNFVLSMPHQNLKTQINVSYISYEKANVEISDLKDGFYEIKMLPITR